MVKTEIVKEIYTQYYSFFISMGKRYGFGNERCKDITHDTFVNVLLNIDSITADTRSGIRSYVIAAYRHRCLSALRKKKFRNQFRGSREESSAAPEGDCDQARNIHANPLQAVLFAEEIRLLNHAIDRLPPKYRQPFRLKFVAGYKPKEIAEELGLTATEIKNIMYRGEKKLAKILNRFNPLKDEG